MSVVSLIDTEWRVFKKAYIDNNNTKQKLKEKVKEKLKEIFQNTPKGFGYYQSVFTV